MDKELNRLHRAMQDAYKQYQAAYARFGRMADDMCYAPDTLRNAAGTSDNAWERFKAARAAYQEYLNKEA